METKNIALTTDELEYLTSMMISRGNEIETFLRMFPMNQDLITMRENHYKFVGKILNTPKDEDRRVAYVVERVESWYQNDQWNVESEVVAVENTLKEAEKFINDNVNLVDQCGYKVVAKIKKISLD